MRMDYFQMIYNYLFYSKNSSLKFGVMGKSFSLDIYSNCLA